MLYEHIVELVGPVPGRTTRIPRTRPTLHDFLPDATATEDAETLTRARTANIKSTPQPLISFQALRAGSRLQLSRGIAYGLASKRANVDQDCMIRGRLVRL